jgi:large subunit ribosomal protein L6
MSRIGKQPIPIPSGVKVDIGDNSVRVQGSMGALEQTYPADVTVRLDEGKVIVERKGDSRKQRAFHGLTRALIANMVNGVSQGFTKSLEVVGYRVQQAGSGVNLQVGYSHPVVVAPMSGITLEVEGNNRIHVRGVDKQVVGEMAARIRRLRKPDAYKGKGIRYAGEQVRLKPGKAAGRM